MKKTETSKERLTYPTRWSLVRPFLRGVKKWYLVFMITSTIVSVLNLVNPKIIGFTVDSVIDSAAYKTPWWIAPFIRAAGGTAWLRKNLWAIALFVAGVALIRGLCRYIAEASSVRASETLVKNMRDDLFSHILRLPYSWHGANATGDIIQRCTSDVETVKVFLSDQLSQLFVTVTMLFLSLFFMFRINVKLALAAAVFIPVIVLYSLFFHSRIASSFEKADEEEGKLSSIAQENLTGVRVVRAFGREAYERKRFEDQNRLYTSYWVRLMRTLSLFWTSGDLVTYLQTLTILVYGSFLAVKGNLTAGDLIAFISYNELLVWPIRALGRMIAEMSKAGIAIDRLRYIMNAEEEKDLPGSVEPPLDKDITFEHVSFAYENGTGDVLSDVSFTIQGGTVFGILGGTGSGKSTLMHLLDRLYDLPAASDGAAEGRAGHTAGAEAAESGDAGHAAGAGAGEGSDAGHAAAAGAGKGSDDGHAAATGAGEGSGAGHVGPGRGRIRIGGVDISHIRRSYLREHVGLVLQEPYLFSRTLSQNIAITQSRLVMPDVRRAARTASLDDTVQRFSRGYDTYVGERGVTLSGGQKQRTAIAQMLIRRPQIMIFDDSLSAVDAETDAKIRQALRNETGKSTVILISHRISTLMGADSILVLDHGKAAAQGTHSELLKKSPIYRKIYDLQMRGAEEMKEDGEPEASDRVRADSGLSRPGVNDGTDPDGAGKTAQEASGKGGEGNG